MKSGDVPLGFLRVKRRGEGYFNVAFVEEDEIGDVVLGIGGEIDFQLGRADPFDFFVLNISQGNGEEDSILSLNPLNRSETI